MSFARFRDQAQVIGLLQRSLGAGRLAHAYLFTGDDPGVLEGVAQALAKTLHCLQPLRAPGHGAAIDCCDRCAGCQRVGADSHPDVVWIRPESKRREIRIQQVRDLVQRVAHKPSEGLWKVAVIAGADRMNDRAANAFLKTLEEPPGNAVIVLLATQPQQLLETIVSRCLRLRFSGTGKEGCPAGEALDFLKGFAEVLSAGRTSVLGRYAILGRLLGRLAKAKSEIEAELAERSPLEQHPEAEKDLRDKWEAELDAAVEAEYRRQRAAVLAGVEWLFRDVWLASTRAGSELMALPELETLTRQVAMRLAPREAMENLQSLSRTIRLLETNAQEALVLEVGLLKLNL